MLQFLAPELRDWIIELLPTQQDFANCRLVCKALLNSSTKCVFRRVIICKRLEALTGAQKIVTSQALQPYVQELIWDCSAYSEPIASDFENYIEACQSSGRAFRDQASVIEDDAHTSLCQGMGLTHRSLPWQDLTLNNMEIFDDEHMYATGMHKGYDDYFRRWCVQRRIERDGTHFQVLQVALRCCPKILRIFISDFTELVGAEEHYNDFRRRMFGNTLEPEELLDFRDVDSIRDEIESNLETVDRQDVIIYTPTEPEAASGENSDNGDGDGDGDDDDEDEDEDAGEDDDEDDGEDDDGEDIDIPEQSL